MLLWEFHVLGSTLAGSAQLVCKLCCSGSASAISVKADHDSLMRVLSSDVGDELLVGEANAEECERLLAVLGY